MKAKRRKQRRTTTTTPCQKQPCTASKAALLADHRYKMAVTKYRLVRNHKARIERYLSDAR